MCYPRLDILENTGGKTAIHEQQPFICPLLFQLAQNNMKAIGDGIIMDGSWYYKGAYHIARLKDKYLDVSGWSWVDGEHVGEVWGGQSLN